MKAKRKSFVVQEYFKFVVTPDWQVEDDTYESLLNDRWHVQVSGSDEYLVWEEVEDGMIHHHTYDTLDKALLVCHEKAIGGER